MNWLYFGNCIFNYDFQYSCAFSTYVYCSFFTFVSNEISAFDMKIDKIACVDEVQNIISSKFYWIFYTITPQWIKIMEELGVLSIFQSIASIAIGSRWKSTTFIAQTIIVNDNDRRKLKNSIYHDRYGNSNDTKW